jgi:RNA polymerase sigma-70 factor, ECF subfamily
VDLEGAQEGLADAGTEQRERIDRLRRSYRNSGEFLFRELAPRMLKVAREVGLEREDAEDAVQEAFSALWERRPELESIEAWLVVVVRRRSIDALRRRGRQPWSGAAASLAPGPENSQEAIATWMSLGEALRRLPARVRTFLELHYAWGFTCTEAAELVGYSPASGKRLLTRTLARLRGWIRL